MENCKIPRDLLIGILARLPVRSLMQFKCVCKFFYFLIKSDNHFKHKHYEISRMSSDYVIFEREIGVFPWPMRLESVFGLVYKENYGDEIRWVNLPMPISVIMEVKCADGMLCLVTSRDDPEGVFEMIWCILIWNPSTREIKELPYIKPHDEFNLHYKAVGFGLSSDTTGKVVMIWNSPNGSNSIVMVCSQNSNSWSWGQFSLFLPILNYIHNQFSDFYLKGKYYWTCIFQEQRKMVLLWFDFDDEIFGKIELPEIHSWATISTMKETIALISCCTAEKQFEIWTMNEHNNIIMWHKYASLDNNPYYIPKRIWNAGGHLLVCSWKLERTGIVDDDGIDYVKQLISVDLVTQERKIICNSNWHHTQYPLLVYSESLK